VQPLKKKKKKKKNEKKKKRKKMEEIKCPPGGSRECEGANVTIHEVKLKYWKNRMRNSSVVSYKFR
jgi:hypothetical protein